MVPGVIFGYVAIALGLYSIFIAITGYGLHPDDEAENTLFLYVFGFCMMPVGVFFSSTYEGIIIDVNKRQFKKYFSVAGIKFGEWEELPEVEAIKIAPYASKYTIQDAIRPAFTINEKKYKVSLFLENVNMALVVAITNRKEALEKANILSSYLHAEILDYIEPV